MKKLVCLLVAIAALSCAHKQIKSNYVFCDNVHSYFEEKMASLQEGMLGEEDVTNITISEQKLVCEGGKAYAKWMTVLEMKTEEGGKICGQFQTIVSFTEDGDNVVYKLLYVSDPEEVPCVTTSST